MQYGFKTSEVSGKSVAGTKYVIFSEKCCCANLYETSEV